MDLEKLKKKLIEVNSPAAKSTTKKTSSSGGTSSSGSMRDKVASKSKDTYRTRTEPARRQALSSSSDRVSGATDNLDALRERLKRQLMEQTQPVVHDVPRVGPSQTPADSIRRLGRYSGNVDREAELETGASLISDEDYDALRRGLQSLREAEMPVVEEVDTLQQLKDNRAYSGSVQQAQDRRDTLGLMQQYYDSLSKFPHHTYEDVPVFGRELTPDEMDATLARLDEEYINARDTYGEDHPYTKARRKARDDYAANPSQYRDLNLEQSWAVGENVLQHRYTRSNLQEDIERAETELWMREEEAVWNQVAEEAAAAGWEFSDEDYKQWRKALTTSIYSNTDINPFLPVADLRLNYNKEEASIYAYLESEGRSSEAGAYYTYLQPIVGERRAADVAEGMSEYDPATQTLTAIVANPFKALNGVNIILQKMDRTITGSDRPIDYHTFNNFGAASDAARANVAQNLSDEFGSLNDLVSGIAGKEVNIPGIGDWTLGTVYNIGMDTINSFVNGALFGKMSLPAMALQSAPSAYIEGDEAGLTESQKWLSFVFTGAIEGGTEYLELMGLFKGLEKTASHMGWKGIIALGLAEGVNGGVQEGANAALTQAADRFFLGDDCAYDRRVRELTEALIGFNFDPDEAAAIAQDTAQDEAWGEILQSTLMGFAGAGGSYIAGAPFASYANTYSTGADIRKQGNQQALASLMSTATGKDVKAPKTAYGTGRMYNDLTQNGEKYAQNIARDERDQAILEYYKQMRDAAQGEQADTQTGDKVNAEILKALQKLGRGKNISYSQQQAINADKSAKATQSAIKGNYLKVDNSKSRAAKAASELAYALPAIKMQPKKGTVAGAHAQADERLDEMNVDTKAKTTTVNGEEVKVTKVANVAQNDTEATVTVKKADGSTADVKISEVTFGKDSRPEAMAYAQDLDTPELANAFILTTKNSQNLDEIANAMHHAYDMAKSGFNFASIQKSTLTNGLSEHQLQSAYDLGVADKAKVVDTQQAAADARQANNASKAWQSGRINMGTVVYETLSNEQKRNLDLIDIVAGLFGMNVEVFESKANANGRYTEENGSYNKATNTIRLDINAGRYYTGDSMAQTAMLRTMSHELTHAMQRNSPKQYAAYKAAVLDVLERQGANIEELVDAKLAADSSLKNRDEAMDEVVADASETMLRDSDAIERLRELHPEQAKTFAQKVLRLIKRIKDAIREAFGNGKLTTEAQYAIKEIDKLAEMWSDIAVATAEASGREYSTGSEDTINNTEAFNDTLEAVQNQARPPYDEAGENSLQQDDVQYSPRNYDIEVSEAEIHKNFDVVRNMQSVISLRGDEITFGDGKMKTKVLEYFKSVGGMAYNKVLGDVELNSRSLKDDRAHGMYPLKALTFYAVPKVIQNGEIINYSPNWEGRNYRTYIIAAPIEVAAGDYKGEYWMGVVVKADANVQNLYTHDVVIINKKGVDTLRTGAAANTAGVSGGTKPSLQSILNKLNDVNPEIQKQARPMDVLSDREILANALEDVATTPEEKLRLAAYKEGLAALNEKQAELDKNKAIIRELMFKKGRTSEDSERLLKARNRAEMLAKEVDRKDKALLNLERMEPIKAIVKREGDKVRKERNAVMKERIADVRQGHENAALRKSITRRAKRLDELVRVGDKSKFVPDNLRDAVADVVSIFAQDDSVFGKKENAQGIPRWQRLQNAYEAMRQTSGDIARQYDEAIAEKLKYLHDTLDGKNIKALNGVQLKAVRDVLMSFQKLISDGNKIFRAGRAELIEDMSNEFIEDASRAKGFYAWSGNSVVKWVRDEMAIPPYFFKRLGGVFEKLGNDILRAESDWGLLVGEYNEKVHEIYKKYHHKDWANKKGDTLQFTTDSGTAIELTREQALSIYAISERQRRDTTMNSHHLDVGGIKLPIDKDGLSVFKAKKLDNAPVPISAKDVTKITAWLTDEQIGYANAMVELMSNDLAKLGNVASRQLHGWEKFQEEFYFPYVTDKSFFNTQLGKTEQLLIKDLSHAKGLAENATSPLELTDFTQTVNRHIANMILYSTFAVPQDNFMRLYDHHLSDGNTIKDRMRATYGEWTNKYIEQLMKDMYGSSPKTTSENVVDEMLGKIRNNTVKNRVLFSRTVTVQQFSSVFRAMYLINPKYFVHSPNLGGWKEAQKYAGTAVIKKMGGFDIKNSGNVVDMLSNENWGGIEGDNVLRKIVDAVDKGAGIAPATADAMTWGAIWQAVKREQAAKTGLSIHSEELKQLAGKRFDEVMRFTQVYGSTLTKSPMMRSSSATVRALATYQGETTLSFNMAYDAIWNKKNTAGQKARAFAFLLITLTTGAISKSLVTAIGDDDDEESVYVERVLRDFTGEMVGNFIPFNYIPIASQIWSELQGFTTTRDEFAFVSNFVKVVEVIGDEDATLDKKLRSIASFGSSMTRVPFYNIYREIKRSGDLINDIQNNGDKEKREGWATNAALSGALDQIPFYSEFAPTPVERIYTAALEGNSEDAERYREYMKVYKGKDDKQINSSLRSEIKGNYENGEIDDETAIRLLTDYTGMEADDAYMKVEEWEYEYSGNGDWKKTAKVTDAIDSGDDKALAAAVEELVEYGGYDSPKDAAQTIASGITSTYKPLYIAASPAERKQMKVMLLDAYETVYETAGLEFYRDSRSKSIDKWLE